MLRVFLAKPAFQQMKVAESYMNTIHATFRVLTSHWMNLRASHAIYGSYLFKLAAKQVCLGPVKRAAYVQILLQKI